MEITLFTKCLFEFIGTLVLVLLGDGVVASTVLKQSKGFNGGWAVITIAWGLAVMCGVLIAGPYSGAHLNPAVSVGLAVAGSFPWAFVPGYIAAQLLGGFCGAVLVYVYYKDHFDATDDPATKLGVFCTMPAIMDKPRNLFCEFLGTFLLVFVILAIGNEQNTPEIGKPRKPARDDAHHGHRHVAGRHDGLCHQPGARPASACGPQHPAHQGEGHERVGLQLGTRNGARTGRTRRRADLRMRLYVRLTAAAPIPPPWPLLTGERLFRIRQEAGRGGRKRIIIINRYRAGHDRDGNRFPG